MVKRGLRKALYLTAWTVGSLAGPASAHVCMDSPTSRVGPTCSSASPQKLGPCGVKGRSSYVTEFLPGQTITVQLNETVDHPSHFRIAFNPNGDAFEDPTSIDDKNGQHPFVLLDGIMDASTAKQSVQVTLPNVSCDNCTLQLIQVMYDKGQNGFGGKDGVAPDNDDIYYACADLVLKAKPATMADAGATVADASVEADDASAGAIGDAGMAGHTPSNSADAGNTGEPGQADDRPASSDEGCSISQGVPTRRMDICALGLLAVTATLARRRRTK